MKIFDRNKRPAVNIGEKFGSLTVCSDTYYKTDSGHRRQHVDCKCDCGNVREYINTRQLKEGVTTFCGSNCPINKSKRLESVPEDRKLCRLGEVYNYLTVTKEAFYHRVHNQTYRCIETTCKCGKVKTYREDKVKKGVYKSCGCVWEPRKERIRCWRSIQRLYGLSMSDYNNMLKDQDGKCAICGSSESKTLKTEYLDVDHCHKTGKNRGLLCSPCNFGLGSFQDDTNRLVKAIEYLNSHS